MDARSLHVFQRDSFHVFNLLLRRTDVVVRWNKLTNPVRICTEVWLKMIKEQHQRRTNLERMNLVR